MATGTAILASNMCVFFCINGNVYCDTTSVDFEGWACYNAVTSWLESKHTNKTKNALAH